MTVHEALDHINTGTKLLLDALSATVAVGVLVNVLPPLAAMMTIIWTGLQIYGWFDARRKAEKDAEK